jgi:hypothetical protein
VQGPSEPGWGGLRLKIWPVGLFPEKPLWLYVGRPVAVIVIV